MLLLAVGGTSCVSQLDPAAPKNRFAGLVQECIELAAGADIAALADLGQLIPVACLLMQVKWMPTLVIGKFLHGVTVTVVLIAGNKMIVETIPKDQCRNFAPISPFFSGLGYVLVFSCLKR